MLSPDSRWRCRATAGALAGVLAVALLAVPSSHAAPRQDLKQVEAQVRDLEMQAGAAHEKAEQARLRLAEVQDELGVIEKRLKRERDELRTVQGSLADIARSVYASGGIDPTLQVLLAEDPTEFLTQAAVMSQLQHSQVAQLRQARTSRLRLAQIEAEITEREAIAAQARADMEAAKQQADSRLQEAQAVLGNLQEQERQRLLQAQRERRAQQAQQAAAAAREASSQGGPSSGSGGSGAESSGGGYAGGSRAQAAVQYALSQVGDPYSFSANPPSSWDCSKLTAAAWAQAGVGLTALSYTQWDQTRRVPVSEIQPGDLVFYFGLGAHHVAIYIGGGKMVSASNPSDGVEIIDFLGPWYRERFSGVGRVIG